MTDPLDAITGDRDTRISEIFYYFEALTSITTGRTVGRKIGIMQEVLLRKYLEEDQAVRRRMYLEQFLLGHSGAAHKVEFSFHPIEPVEGLAVGDEIPGTDGVTLSRISPETDLVRVSLAGRGAVTIGTGRPVPKKTPIFNHLTAQGKDIRVVGVDENQVTIDVVDRSRLLASIESKRVGAQRFSGSEKLGAGIQTVEKAKQASLVAVDLDLRHNGSIKPLQDPGVPKKLLSIVALGNGVHWTDKDRAILGTYVDYTWLVRDEAIVRYAEYVRELAGEDYEFLPYFMDYFKGMTVQAPDDFTVQDEDFSIITPEGEQRNLIEVLRTHISTVDDV
jgi:hypothetical protein